MKLDAISIREIISNMEEKQAGSEKEDIKKLLCTISGNKAYLSQIDLNDILYLIENAENILQKEMDYVYPKIDLKMVPASCSISRRPI